MDESESKRKVIFLELPTSHKELSDLIGAPDGPVSVEIYFTSLQSWNHHIGDEDEFTKDFRRALNDIWNTPQAYLLKKDLEMKGYAVKDEYDFKNRLALYTITKP